MSSLCQEMQEILKNNVVDRHSYFQLKYFVIGKEPTTQSKMWQCLRELKTRLESLEAIDMEIDEGKDNLELININVEKMKQKEQTIERQIRLRKLNRRKVLSENNLKKLEEKKVFLQEESKFFLEAFKSLEKNEKLKPFDDLDSQKEYWGEKLLQKINLKILMQAPIDTELMETVLALPDDIPIKERSLKSLNLKHKKLLEGQND